MPQPSTLCVIDIGKTNKKVLLFDENLSIIDSAYRSFDDYEQDGVRYEDVENAFAWIKQQIAEFATQHRISAVSITTHGATAMGVDADGALAFPPVAYTTEAGDAFDEEFHRKFGSREALQEETATAEVGSLVNLGKLLYFVKKHWPDKFDATERVLFYPQYFGFLLTGQAGAEPTYTGCHTYLYDPRNHRPSSVAKKLGLDQKMPADIRKSWEVLGTVSPAVAAETGLAKDCIVTLGIHDSNASLLPYLVKGHENFVLNSTGTWCVAMHPTNRIEFAPSELGKLVFYNLDAFFNPVKTSIFMGGLEFETYRDVLRGIHGAIGYPEFDPTLFQRVIDEKRLFVLPSVVRGTGIFPNARPRVIEDGQSYSLDEIRREKALPNAFRDPRLTDAALVLSLALQTRAALNVAGYDGKGTIFTEGGFRNNTRYNPVLADLYPGGQCLLTDFKEATAFGAALLAQAALEGKEPTALADRFDINTTTVTPAGLSGLEDYANAFFQHLETPPS